MPGEERARPLLFVPARPVHEPGRAPYGIEVRRLANGRYGCTAYSTVDRLTAALGMCQPWVGVPAAELVRCLDRIGVDRLDVDADLPADTWRWQQGQLSALAEREERAWQPDTR